MARTDLGLRDRSDDTEGNTFVEAAHPIALEIDRHVLIADGAQLTNEALADLGLERARQFVATDLEPGERPRTAAGRTEILEPVAPHTEPHRPNRRFSALDDLQFLCGDFRVIRNTR